MLTRAVALGLLLLAGGETQPSTYRLDSTDGLELVGVRAERATYRGRKAVRLVGIRTTHTAGGRDPETIAVVTGSSFAEGTIELDLAGAPEADTDTSYRGFIGVAFHVQPDRSHLRAFYLRPTNGRADDQLRRNHATQYIAEPDYPWFRLRREQPGVYESYADMETGAWTHVKVVVSGGRALLYVNRAPQPALVVNDMKPGVGSGQVALWIGVGTEGYFSNLVVK